MSICVRNCIQYFEIRFLTSLDYMIITILLINIRRRMVLGEFTLKEYREKKNQTQEDINLVSYGVAKHKTASSHGMCYFNLTEEKSEELAKFVEIRRKILPNCTENCSVFTDSFFGRMTQCCKKLEGHAITKLMQRYKNNCKIINALGFYS